MILAIQRAKTFDVETSNAPIGFNSDVSVNRGLTSPTQELAASFGTIKGKTIFEDLKSTSNTTGYDQAAPFANRDPRLNLSLFYNGSDWLRRAER
nr:RagB/SusD family nutrient uptake outer membrane protein [Pedobacter sp. ASV2]